MKKYMPLNGLRWSRDSGSTLCGTPQNGRSRTGWGGIVVAIGSYFNDYNYVFRIPSVILLIGCFYKINIDNQSMCRRMRIYSTHFFCLHYSLIIVMQHLPKMYLDDKLIQMLEVLILCLLISNIIIYFKQFKYFSWLKYSM